MILDKHNTYEAKFIEENREAISIIKDIFEGVIHDFIVMADSSYKFTKNQTKSYDEFVLDMKDEFFPAILKQFLSMDSDKLYHFMNNIEKRIADAPRYVNVYGTPKYGELSRDKDDILNSLQHSLVFGDENEVGFNVDSNIAVFIYDRAYNILPKETYRNDRDFCNCDDCIIALDVNAAFIRLISSKDKFGLEWDALLKDIRMAIFSKIVAYGYSMRAIVHILKDKFDDQSIYNDMDLYRILELTLARWAYSVANNLSANQEYGVDLNTLIDYVKASANLDIPTKGVMDLSNLGMSKLRGKEYMMRRSIDKYLDDVKETYKNDYVRVNINPYAHNMPIRTHRKMYSYKHSPRSSYRECYPERLLAAYESWNYTENKAAAFNFYGMEAYLKPTDPKFAEFRREERQDILSKLTFTERKRYTDIENDFIMLKASVVNTSTIDAQHVLLKRCAMLRDVVNLELERTNNEYLATLLYALDTDIFSLQSDLSDRNIFKERNTRLYGQVKSTGKWDY